MESAIPKSLKCPRTRTRRIPDDYLPPYPAWVARANSGSPDMIMAYFGVQAPAGGLPGVALDKLGIVEGAFAAPDGPGHHDLAHYVDEAGYDNFVAIAYWRDAAVFARWRDSPAVADWWNAEERLLDGVGYFREIITPSPERYETLFSTDDDLEGAGVLLGGHSGEIQEHGYWGSARDRLPLSQTDEMAPAGELTASGAASGKRIRVRGHDNLALIRSGQAWGETEAKERDLYLGSMEPTLREGMEFLRDNGRPIRCYTNRYMRHITARGEPQDKSFGMSYWRSLADMERWAESHPTHVKIFATFMDIGAELQFQLKLRLYHEVSVLTADQQDYEYINCHPSTGLLGCAVEAAELAPL